MNLLKEELPKEIKKDEFEEFLEKIEEDMPADEFPEIFIQYCSTDSRIIVLGIGESSECAEQTTQALEKKPELKEERLELKILRAPETGFLLRCGT
jgi:hypothetical protein